MRKVTLLLGLLAVLCFATSGCLRPQKEVIHVITHPGQPVQLLQNLKIRGQSLKSGDIVEVDVGGGIWMPYDHWKEVKKILEAADGKKD